MGGEINATSTEGRGTTFTVRLLLSEAAPLPSSERAAAEGVRNVISYAGLRRKVLLIDDDPSHIDIVRQLLRPLEFELLSPRRTAPAGSSWPRNTSPTWR